MPLVQNPSIGAGAAPLFVATQQITSAQILAMVGTGVQVVPAPGTGKIINVIGMAFCLTAGTVAYVFSGSDGGLSAQFGTGGDGVTTPVTGVIQSAANAYGYSPGETLAFFGPVADDVNQPILLFGANNYDVGPILTTSLGAGGLGYAANDTGTITNGANDATYKVLTVGAGGAVLTYQITGAGTVCTVANGNATVDGGAQPGVGVGFTVNITAVQTGNGTLKVVTYYQIIPFP